MEENTDRNQKTLLTFSNIQYLVEGLDVLLHTNLSGDKRTKVIKLRDDLNDYIHNFFNEYS